MKPRYTTTLKFERHYQERIAKNEVLMKDYKTGVDLFFDDPQAVNDHGLAGVMKDCRAFWLNEAYRIVYQVRNGEYLFVDVGTHDEVYTRRFKTSRVKGKELL